MAPKWELGAIDGPEWITYCFKPLRRGSESYARELSKVGKGHTVLNEEWKSLFRVKVTRSLPPCPNGYLWQVSSQPSTSRCPLSFPNKEAEAVGTYAYHNWGTSLHQYTSAPGSILHPLFPFSAIIKPVKLLPLECRLLKRWHRILTLCFLLLPSSQWFFIHSLGKHLLTTD